MKYAISESFEIEIRVGDYGGVWFADLVREGNPIQIGGGGSPEEALRDGMAALSSLRLGIEALEATLATKGGKIIGDLEILKEVWPGDWKPSLRGWHKQGKVLFWANREFGVWTVTWGWEHLEGREDSEDLLTVRAAVLAQLQQLKDDLGFALGAEF